MRQHDVHVDASLSQGGDLLVVMTAAEHGSIVLEVRGEIDLATNATLERSFCELLAIGVDIIVDLSGVTFADSHLVRCLERLHAAAVVTHKTVSVRRPTPAVGRMLALFPVAASMSGQP